jgi:hypothetical protein
VLGLTVLEHDPGPLDRADDPHVAADPDIVFEDIDVAGFEGAEDAVKHLQRQRKALGANACTD